MARKKFALKSGWQVPKRFVYVPFAELCAEDRRFVESGKPYRLQGHALLDCWLYPVRRDGRLTLSARRLRLNIEDRKQRKVQLLNAAEAETYRQQALACDWDTWSYSGKHQLKLSKDYYVAERLPDLRARMLRAFAAEDAPATPLGVAWIPPGAYDKSHFHDVDVIVVALSKRNETGQLEIKKGQNWVAVPYDVGEAVLIPKYVEHRVRPPSIDRFTATLSLLN
jgi:hypothetical protein